MPRGGRRRGAGAPIGNLNALKSGARSKRVVAIMQALAHDEETRLVLTHLARSGKARASHYRELARGLARFMYDHPLAVETSRRLDEIVAREYAAYDTREAERNLAKYEQLTRRDAFTGKKLNRNAMKTPEQQARTNRLRARLEAYKKIRDAAEALDRWEAWADGDHGFIPILGELYGGPEDPAPLIQEMIEATKSALTRLPEEGPFSARSSRHE